MRFLLLALIPLLTCVAAAQAITAKNWLNHPAILEVRGMYTAVNALVAGKKLKLESRRFSYCPSWDLERTKYTDSRGIVRRYVKAGGSEDSAVTLEHTYDSSARLRFVLVTAGAVNDTREEWRFYFGANGKRLWLDRRRTGPGYTFAEKDFVNAFVLEPRKAFVAAPPCR
ncbi:MAG: hypothetical protein HC933_02825 [Pleurocapsa sp. SU_196_0]|nr:hypothetical protein [Pleurocapsa sp. SU_196_0]